MNKRIFLILAFIGATAEIDADIKQAAKAYGHYFDRHAEKPLLPCYEEFGGEFLRWVEGVSGRRSK